MKRYLGKFFEFVASLGLSAVLFLLLLVLTYLGTLHQVDHGLYEAQQKYFASLLVVHEAFGAIPVPLPGGYLLMMLLCVNLVCGAIFRAHRGWGQLGILVAHVGIILLLVGSFVTFQHSVSGHMTLYEGESADTFLSYHEWEMAVAEAGASGSVTEYIVDGADLAPLGAGKTGTFRFASLPFDLVVGGYVPNAEPRPTDGSIPLAGKAVDGYYLQSLALDKEHERNMPGAYVRAVTKDSNDTREGIVWTGTRLPLTVSFGEATWTIHLRKRSWQLPFTIKLDRVTRELHPNTRIPRVFMSEVTKMEDGASQAVRVSMNEPLRRSGFTFYQSGWGPQNAAPGDALYSTFSVVKNPADQVPLYSCIVTTLGLMLHFALKLLRFFKAGNREAS